MENGAYILASETCAIDVLGAEFIQDIHEVYVCCYYG